MKKSSRSRKKQGREMFSIKRSVATIVAGMVCAFLSWASFAEAGADLKRVRLAYAGWGVGSAVAYVGIESGLFKKFELDVEEVFIQDALTGGTQALIGVDFAIGFGNPLAIFQPILGGADIVFLGSHVSAERVSMGVSSDIAAIKELKGKKIGVSRLGGRSDLIARVILRRAGLDPLKDVEIVTAGLAPQRVLALTKNLIQGAPLSPEFASEAKGLGLKILEVKEVPVIASLLMTTRTIIKKDEEAVRRFIKAYAAAIHYYLTRRAESIGIMRKYLTVKDPSALETMYEAFAAQLKPLPVPSGEAVQALIDAVSVADQRAKAFKPPDLFDLRFLEELKASGFIENLYSEKVSL
jgi:ABC-type nitrate/sulfonate/bicarbonate transport system substrate-binding protein